MASAGTWRGGPVPAPPSAAQQAGGPPAAPVTEEPTQQGTQNRIALERTQDLYWLKPPTDMVWHIINRRERIKKAKSRMPVVLRNLAPDSVFDPRAAWAAEKQRRSEAAEVEGSAPRADGTARPRNRREALQQQNMRRMLEKKISDDWQMLNNAARSAKKGSITEIEKVQTQTEAGKLHKLLLLLEHTLIQENYPAAFDVLWAIEKFPLFLEAEREVREARARRRNNPKLSMVGGLVYGHRRDLRRARDLRKDRDMVRFQLLEMHDRLPPLSSYHRVFKLDDWQCRVLDLVDQDKSAIVCAPTSSGKTVISTYVSIKIATLAAEQRGSGISGTGGVVFVVPSEPLVWQVAAMFEKMLPGQVALATDLMRYRPEKAAAQSDIVVGTPTALESALSKVRGKVGAEMIGAKDYAQMIGGFSFRYAVFDEVHSLDGEEGGALQRLMRLLECPFLALSATIGNAEELQDFWRTVRESHVDVISGFPNAQGERVRMDPAVHLERHEGRFINIQRLVFQGHQLTPLHPCAAVTQELLRTRSMESLALSFTPRDAYALWEAFEKHVSDKSKVDEVNPTTFFAQFGDPKKHQITLLQAKNYENALKAKLESFAKDETMSREVEAILGEFRVEEHTAATATGAADAPENAAPDFSLYDFARRCREDKLFPALFFQLDTFKCVEQFKDLLGSLETRQRIERPNHYADLEAKRAAEEARRREIERILRNDRNGANNQQVNVAPVFVDVEAPHPGYVLSPPHASMSTAEFEDILKEMSKDNEQYAKSHPLVRGLRRGIGIYIEGVASSVYRRVVQRLAQQGKLAVVFSDHSLAYGVNMPFRTCAFCGDMGGLLTPLMAQQMSGRAGRRGLDTQGNLVFLGMRFDSIRKLILGEIPNIEGKDQLYSSMVLQEVLSEFVTARQMRNACQSPFAAYQQGPDALVGHEGFYELSVQLLEGLGIIDQDKQPQMPITALTMAWELRSSISESLALAFCLDKFLIDFVHDKSGDYAERESAQIDFFVRLAHVLDRRPPAPGTTPLHETSYITKYPERQAGWDEWERLLVESQARFDSLDPDLKQELETRGLMDNLKLKVPPGQPIDSALFQVFMTKRVPTNVSSIEKFRLVRRLFDMGNKLIQMHNCLAQPGKYQKLELVTRKSFTRIRYILTDTIKQETSLTDQSQLSQPGRGPVERSRDCGGPERRPRDRGPEMRPVDQERLEERYCAVQCGSTPAKEEVPVVQCGNTPLQ